MNANSKITYLTQVLICQSHRVCVFHEKFCLKIQVVEFVVYYIFDPSWTKTILAHVNALVWPRVFSSLRSHLLLFTEFLQVKISHFHPHNREFSMQIVLWVQVGHADWPNRKFFDSYDLCFIYRFASDNRQWSFFAVEILFETFSGTW